MAKYSRASTVGELKALLALVSDDMPICSAGPDCGGYDYEHHPYVDLKFLSSKQLFGNEAKNDVTCLCLEHSEYEEWQEKNNRIAHAFKNDQGH